ncbi:ABC transporter permease subunit, partial [bacterium]|nr:ABC transporter permease subunit [bacterium]
KNILFHETYGLDWIFIAGIVISFFALVLTFDSINGDRIRGVLPLTMSNSVSRSDVIIGKFLSRFVIIFIPFLMCFIISMLSIQTFSEFNFSMKYFTSIVIFFIVFSIYISVFLWIGIFFSAITDNPQKSIMLLLFIWFLLIVIIPATGKLTMVSFSSSANRNRYEHRLTLKEKEFELRDVSLKERTFENRMKIRDEQTRFRGLHFLSYMDGIMERIESARKILRISPYCTFRFITEEITSGGIASFTKFYEKAKQYKMVVAEFLISEDKNDPKSKHIFTEYTRRLVSNNEVDYSLFPRFENMPGKDNLFSKTMLLDFAILFMFFVLSFVCAWSGFIRMKIT